MQTPMAAADTPSQASAEARPLLTEIARVASTQGGCVSRADLLSIGATRHQVRSLERRGALARVFRGIYLFAAPSLSQESLWWASLLLGGREARLGFRSALESRDVLTPSRTEVTVVVPRPRGGQRTRATTLIGVAGAGRAAVNLVPTRSTHAAHRLSGGLWAEGVAQAIVQLASTGEVRDVRRAWREADYLGLLEQSELRAALDGRAGLPSVLRELLREQPLVGGAGVDLRSRAERRLLEALVAAGVADPRSNALVDFNGRLLRPDLWWPSARLVVEVDGPAHRRPARAAEDAARDEFLAEQGVRVLRFTDDRVWRDTARVVAEITAALAEPRG